ncbi:MAG: HAD hydrolase-like protein [Cellulomonadaceae bacterium]
MRPELVLLDLDGTLTDSAPGIIASVRHAFAALDLPAPGPDDLRRFVGPPIEESLLRHGVRPERLEEARTAYREAFTSGGMFDNRVYDGVLDTLAALRGAGVRLALATSKPEVYARRITAHFGLDTFLEAQFGASLDTSRSEKADVITYGLRELKDSAAGLPDLSSILMVGDRLHDVLGARANGLDCLGVAWGYADTGELAQAGARAVVHTPAELTAALLG